MKTYPDKSDMLKNRVILITGASSGIGRSVATTCAAHGATVILSGQSPDRLAQVYDDIIHAGDATPAILPINLAGASYEDYQTVYEAINKEFGRLDGLLHNAAILGPLSPIEHYPVKQWYHVMQVNLHAPFLLTQTLIPLLKRSQDPSIVLTSADVGRVGKAFWGAYAVSKFGIEGLTQILSEELSEDALIRVNVVNPGRVHTPLRQQAYPAEDLNRHPKPDDIMAHYLYLLGPDSRGMTGLHFTIVHEEEHKEEPTPA